jgi:hypothetical protein
MGTKTTLVRDKRSYELKLATPGSPTFGPPYENVVPFFSYGATEMSTRTGVNVADYKGKIKRLEDASSNYNADITRFKRTNASAELKFYLNRYPGNFQPAVRTQVASTIKGSVFEFPGFASMPYDPLADLSSKAKIAFLLKAKKRLTSFNSLQFFGELRETIHMIARPASAMREAYSEYLGSLVRIKKNLKSKERRRRALQSTFLEFQFGVRPLIADTIDAAHAIAKSVAGSAESNFVQEFSTADWKSQPALYGGTFGGIGLSWSTRTSFQWIVRYKGKLKAYVPNTVARNFGVMPEDFIPTAWELLPWSWAIDYFTNVGDMINAASFPVCSLQYATVTSSTKREFTASPLNVFNGSGIAANDYVGVSGTADSFFGSRFQMVRNKDINWGIGTYRFKLTGIPGVERLCNLGAAISLHRSLVPFY